MAQDGKSPQKLTAEKGNGSDKGNGVAKGDLDRAAEEFKASAELKNTDAKGNRFKVNDRVKRSREAVGSLGTVKDVRQETTSTTHENREKGILITVQWDNGTFSYHGPAGLERA